MSYDPQKIIKIHNNVPWDWKYSTQYPQIFYIGMYMRIFHGIVLVPQNIVMDMNNITHTNL